MILWCEIPIIKTVKSEHPLHVFFILLFVLRLLQLPCLLCWIHYTELDTLPVSRSFASKLQTKAKRCCKEDPAILILWSRNHGNKKITVFRSRWKPDFIHCLINNFLLIFTSVCSALICCMMKTIALCRKEWMSYIMNFQACHQVFWLLGIHCIRK